MVAASQSQNIRTIHTCGTILAQGPVVSKLPDGRLGVQVSENPENILFGTPVSKDKVSA